MRKEDKEGLTNNEVKNHRKKRAKKEKIENAILGKWLKRLLS